MRLLERLLRNHPLANILFVVVLALGALAYARMPREQDPEINFNWVNITTLLPGAAAEDVERRVTQPLEDAIKNVPDVRFVLSSSRENVSSILVRFRGAGRARIRQARERPAARDPEQGARRAAAGGQRAARARDHHLERLSDRAGAPRRPRRRRGAAPRRSRAARRPRAARGGRSGVRDRPARCGAARRVRPGAACRARIDAAQLADAIAGWFRDTFAGKQRAGDEAWIVRLLGQAADPGALARVSVAVPGTRERVPLDALAEVSRARADARTLAASGGRPAVLLSVTKKSYTNTLALLERIGRLLEERAPLLAPAGIAVALTDDQTVPTRNAIAIMESNALLGLALVLAVCWFFLGTRVSVLVALGIPFSLAGAFAILHAVGFTLNISVLLGIVIVLGMLVDDAVVVVEAIYYRVERGEQALAAALAALREVFAPVTASVATTVAAFLPLMLLPGIVGKFMFVIPFVVTVALAVSLVEAYWMLPTHVVALRLDLSRPTRLQRMRHRFTRAVRLAYTRALVFAMRRPVQVAALILLAVAAAGAAVAGGLVRMEFFAFDPIRVFYVSVDMPAGAPVEATLERVQAVERAVRAHLAPGEARALTSIAGIKFTDTEPVQGDAHGQVIVSLYPRQPGMRDVTEIVEAMRRDIEALPGPGRTSFLVLSGGPPVTKPVRVRLRNDDYSELRAAADALLAIVRAAPGTRDVTDDDLPGRPQLVLRLDAEAVRAAGLDPALVARLVRLHVDGEVVAELRDRGEKVEVRVRAAREPAADPLELLEHPIAIPGANRSTPLGALVRAETQIGKGVIRHYNLRRAITVEADIDRSVTDTVAVNRAIREGWERIQARYPSTTLDFSGELDDVYESLEAMKLLFVLGVGLIYVILAAQFRSYWQPAMILVTVPLAFAGVVFGLLVSRQPGFLALHALRRDRAHRHRGQLRDRADRRRKPPPRGRHERAARGDLRRPAPRGAGAHHEHDDDRRGSPRSPWGSAAARSSGARSPPRSSGGSGSRPRSRSFAGPAPIPRADAGAPAGGCGPRIMPAFPVSPT
ncbi:MAG: efflux RND transporter permease subunit [Burkholderiales bacterium]|nr:efflux RND transporter permease subunit [Burkholderiales bacterium]